MLEKEHVRAAVVKPEIIAFFLEFLLLRGQMMRLSWAPVQIRKKKRRLAYILEKAIPISSTPRLQSSIILKPQSMYGFVDLVQLCL
jgi:hypothetical protein